MNIFVIRQYSNFDNFCGHSDFSSVTLIFIVFYNVHIWKQILNIYLSFFPGIKSKKRVCCIMAVQVPLGIN